MNRVDGRRPRSGFDERLGGRAEQLLPAARDARIGVLVDGWVGSMWIGVGLAAVALVSLVVRGQRPARAPAAVGIDGRAAAGSEVAATR